jgi:hypothetical protein
MSEQNTLKSILFHLRKSNSIYQLYLENEEIYVYAKILFDSNNKLNKLLIESGGLLNESLDESVIALNIHLEAWMLNWKEYEKLFNGVSIFERFHFETKFPFPKEAEKTLIDFYSKINKDGQ